MSAAKLRVVRPGEAPAVTLADPEGELALLFRREAALLGDLADVRRDLVVQRRRYGTKHNLLILPGLDTLRRLFGG